MHKRMMWALLAMSSIATAQTQVPGMPVRDASTIREVPLAPMPKDSLALDPASMPAGRDSSGTARPTQTARPIAVHSRATPVSTRPRLEEDRSEGAEARVLRTLTKNGRDALLTIAPAPARIYVREGEVVQLPVGIGKVNRLRTPFNSVQIERLGPGKIKDKGGDVYVTTSSTEELSLFVTDASNPSRAISLVLLPRGIPPVDVPISFRPDVVTGAAAGQVIPTIAERAEDWEQQQPYTEAITALFRSLALQRVPDGYGLESVMGASPVVCRWAGVRLELRQRVTGASLDAVVLRAVNQGMRSVALPESACDGARVKGVATWPRNELAPGEETEVFVALGSAEDDGSVQRPSVLSRGAR